MAGAIRLLYLDDCEIEHRLFDAYLRYDQAHTYDVTKCMTLEEAEAAMHENQFDALVLDNRVPPYANYHKLYDRLAKKTGFSGPTMVVSADISGAEFNCAERRGSEIVVDKAELLDAIREGAFAQAILPSQAA